MLKSTPSTAPPKQVF
jgi:hypothetical protein